MQMKLGHVKLGVSDIKRSVEWYTQVLGFEIDSFTPEDTPWGTRKFTIADPDGNELGFSKQL